MSPGGIGLFRQVKHCGVDLRQMVSLGADTPAAQADRKLPHGGGPAQSRADQRAVDAVPRLSGVLTKPNYRIWGSQT